MRFIEFFDQTALGKRRSFCSWVIICAGLVGAFV